MTSRIRQAKANYLAGLTNPYTTDHKRFWRYFTHLKQSTISDPIEHTEITPEITPDALNGHFCSIPTRIWDNLPESNTTPVTYLHMNNNCPEPFSIEPIEEEVVMSIISNKII